MSYLGKLEWLVKNIFFNLNTAQTETIMSALTKLFS